MKSECRIAVTPGFLLMLSVLFYLDEGVDLLGWSLLACSVHELGHIAIIYLFGGKIERLKLTAVGAELELNSKRPLSYVQECLAALAGPMANLFLAGVAMGGRLFLLAGLSLGQGVFNLLPLLPLDGGRCLYFALGRIVNINWAEAVLCVTSAVTTGILLGIGFVFGHIFGNITLLITALWLFAGLLKRNVLNWKPGFWGKGKKPLQFRQDYGNIP